MMYPVYMDEHRCLGRIHEVMSYQMDMLAGAGIQVGNILEERAVCLFGTARRRHRCLF